MNQQQQAAMESMAEWLAHPQELGRRPAKLECAGEFDLHELHYYIFKYKRSVLGRWLLGVCGGYEGEGLEHCGHVFSQMQPFDPATAREQAEAIVEQIRSYWMERAKEAAGDGPESKEREGGPFVSFVLLGDFEWDREQYVRDLQSRWGIRAELGESGDPGSVADSLVWEVDGMMAAVSMVPAPVPGEEAEHNAANNYHWREAVEVTASHVAHLMVAVLPREKDVLEAGKLLVKLCDAALEDSGALGVYTAGTVFQPAFYREAAEVQRQGALPYLNWIYFGLRQHEAGVSSGYTYGLEVFGCDEVEVLNSTASLVELRGFLLDVSAYILSAGVTLQDGETIGFSEEEKLPITRSDGVYLDGQTLKIGFMPAQ